ncbi:hypothetical protein HDU67_010242 [Dinochytrium kinnereticum]|nr:hypothetical protein HDU67_010242 [Dinochytrium kinnereticum]
MTRTRRISYQGSSAFHDRHLQRNGGEVKGTIKKNGAGHYNWGSPYDDLEDMIDYDVDRAPETKIQVMDENRFKIVKEMAYSSSP